MLEKYNFQEVLSAIKNTTYQPCPKYDNREFWNNIPEELRTFYIDKASSLIDYNWQVIPISSFLKFQTEGDRSCFENKYTERRKVLGSLFVAELLEGEGKYISQIIDGIWCICEETGWQASAHNWKRPDEPDKPLPDAEDCMIDLCAGDTAGMLSWIYYLMGDRLAQISQMITRRMEYELERRIMKPFLESTEYWWMSYDPNLHVNNWNPWVNSNCMTTFLFVCKDKGIIAKALYKSMYCIDKYIRIYSEDGACDEGSTYWFQGPALLFTCLDILKKATGGMVDISDEHKICEMASFIYNADLFDNKFMNFADGSASFKPNYSMIYRFGEYTNNSQLMEYSAPKFAQSIIEMECIYQFPRLIPALCIASKVTRQYSNAIIDRNYPQNVWYDELQVMVAHESADGMGFTIAAKGGHNAENHNHNDVGNFVLIHDGKWIFVDAGVGVYTKQTFGPKRYEIWSMKSEYHNVPKVGEYNQKNGRVYSAKNVLKQNMQDEIVLTMDISDAYPEDAGIIKYERKLEFGINKKSGLVLVDEYALSEARSVTLNFMTIDNPLVTSNEIILGKVKFSIGEDVHVNVERVDIDDEKLNSCWGDCLYRIQLTNPPADMGRFELKVTSC